MHPRTQPLVYNEHSTTLTQENPKELWKLSQLEEEGEKSNKHVTFNDKVETERCNQTNEKVNWWLADTGASRVIRPDSDMLKIDMEGEVKKTSFDVANDEKVDSREYGSGECRMKGQRCLPLLVLMGLGWWICEYVLSPNRSDVVAFKLQCWLDHPWWPKRKHGRTITVHAYNNVGWIDENDATHLRDFLARFHMYLNDHGRGWKTSGTNEPFTINPEDKSRDDSLKPATSSPPFRK